jgi:hypothetical protein
MGEVSKREERVQTKMEEESLRARKGSGGKEGGREEDLVLEFEFLMSNDVEKNEEYGACKRRGREEEKEKKEKERRRRFEPKPSFGRLVQVCFAMSTSFVVVVEQEGRKQKKPLPPPPDS